jgi:hypothetical protein
MKHEKLLRPVQFVPYIMAAAPYYTKNRMGIKNRNSAGQDVKKYKTKRCDKIERGFVYVLSITDAPAPLQHAC